MVDEERARSFGPAADAYDRWRPGYPPALYDEVLGARPGRILEAGAGTGKATVDLAGRGAAVTAVEPDAAMAAVARERTAGLGVDVVVSPFEDIEPEPGAYDRVCAAQCWHWIDPDRGAAVARRALRIGGELCVWINRPRSADGPVWDAVRSAYAAHAPELLDGPDRLRYQSERERALPPAPGFGPWRHWHTDWSRTYDAVAYSELVATMSDHLVLPTDRRRRLVDAVRDAIVGTGGALVYDYRTVLVRARVDPAG